VTQPPDEQQATATFAQYVRERHGFRPTEIVRRPELDGGGYIGLTAMAEGHHVRGLASSDRVLTYAEPRAIDTWLRATDFAHSPDADPVQFIHVYRSLQPPPEDRYAEDSFPLLYEAQLATAPVDGVGEPVTLPRLEDADGGRRVEVWYQLEPGSRLERRTFVISSDNTVEDG
jgi:hypothetical protein